MSAYDIQLLEDLFEEYCQKINANGEKLSNDRGAEFEKFSIECLFKARGIPHTTLIAGITGDYNDGGIDAIFVELNGSFVDESILDDSEALKENGRDSHIKCTLVQCKLGKAYGSDVPSKIDSTVEDFFNSENYKNGYLATKVTYNSEVIGKFKFIQDLIGKIRLRPENIKFDFYVCTKSEGEYFGEAVEYIDSIKERIQQYYSGASVTFTDLGPKDLYTLWDSQDDCIADLVSTKSLELDEQMLYLVSLPDYYDFITDDRGDLRTALFDGNVRDFLGPRVEINQKIDSSLSEFDKGKGVPFWWLNNGITITCGETPSKTGARWTLKDVQIVNGLQTSNVLYNHYKSNPSELKKLREESDGKNANWLVVKVISTMDASSRNKIIQATNSQSPVPIASLRATDEIQRKIEAYFSSHPEHGLTYDRRKGSASNKGIPSSNAIQIEELAQAVLSAALLMPDTARARPGSALKKDNVYSRVFNESNFTLPEYGWMARAFRKVEGVLSDEYYSADSNNILFYVLILVAAAPNREELCDMIVEKEDSTSRGLKQKKQKLHLGFDPSEELILAIAEAVHSYMGDVADNMGSEMSKVAKGSKFKVDLVARASDKRTNIYRSMELS